MANHNKLGQYSLLFKKWLEKSKFVLLLTISPAPGMDFEKLCFV